MTNEHAQVLAMQRAIAAAERNRERERIRREEHRASVEFGEARRKFLKHWEAVGRHRWRCDPGSGKWFPTDGFYAPSRKG